MNAANIFVEISKETKNFDLKYRLNRKTGRPELILKSKKFGGHYAAHTRFNLLDESGHLLEIKEIDSATAKFIMENFEERGDTASFDIFENDLKTGRVNKNRLMPNINPLDVRHKLTTNENSFTSTGAKLNNHWPIFKKYEETGYGSIIRATLTLHQVCSSHCHYCSTISRNKKDSISLQEAKDFVLSLYEEQALFNRDHFPEYNEIYKKLTGSDIRLKGLILSGGGQPNLWPHFEEFVTWLSGLDIDLGLITNGFPEKIDENIYKNFKWVRISITPEDASPHYRGGKFNRQYIPETLKNNSKTTVGYSYVYGAWTDEDILERINLSIEENDFQYCRLLTDCNLTRTSQLLAHQRLANKLFDLGIISHDGTPLKKMFHQLKYHGEPGEANELWSEGQCYLQIYNVFWDTTGHEENGRSYCYACDSITVLAEEELGKNISALSERRFNHEKWGTVTNDQIEDLYKKPVKSYFDPKEICTACLFMRNNQAIKNMVNENNFDELIVNQSLQHVNFP